MSKNTSTFNAYQDLNGSGSTKVAPAITAQAVVVTGDTAPVIGTSFTYLAAVDFENGTGTEPYNVLWSVIRVSGTGVATINQKGQADFSATVVGDVYDVEAASRYTGDNFDNKINVVSSPSIDGGRSGAIGGTPSHYPAAADGFLAITIQAAS